MSKPKGRKTPLPSPLPELKRVLAETLVRSGIDMTDEVLTLAAFLADFRWREGAPAGEILGAWEGLRRDAPARHELRMEIPLWRYPDVVQKELSGR